MDIKKIFYLSIISICCFFTSFAGFLAPIVGGGVGVPLVGKALGINKKIASFLGPLTNKLYYFILFVFVIILFFFINRIRIFLYKRRLRKIKVLIARLQSDLILFKNADIFSKEQRLNIDEERKETLSLVIKNVGRRFFVKRIGRSSYKKFVKALEIIKDNNLNIDDQIGLVNTWLFFVSHLD